MDNIDIISHNKLIIHFIIQLNIFDLVLLKEIGNPLVEEIANWEENYEN